MYGPGSYPPYGYPPPPYTSGVVYVPVQQSASPTPKASRGVKKMEKMAKKSLVQRLEEIDLERADIERYLKSKEPPKKDEKKPEGFFNKTFSFAETWLMVIVFALPMTLILNRLVKFAVTSLGIQ